VVLAEPVDSTAATGLVDDLRGRLAPRALAGTRVQVAVGGLTAQYADLSARTAERLPLVVVIVQTLSFAYLVIVFRSLLLPAKAVLMNVLTTAAALGLTVFVFQDGHGASLLRFTSAGTLQAYLPVALFALLFGLSMDYEVFLVRRFQEEWWRSGETNGSAASWSLACWS
jgi:RND superfamily putative drug exporter